MINIKKLIIAHRGIHNNNEIPENSLLAFKKAKDLNYPIELDIQLTKDNNLIIMHDENLKRMTNIDKNVKDLTLKEIKELNLLNTSEKIPTLREVLNLIDGKILIDIEIKNTNKIKIIVNKLLEELNLYNGDIIIKSFNPKIVKYLKNIQKKYLCGLLLKEKEKYNKKIYKYLITTNMLIKYCTPDFIAISKKLVNSKEIKEYKKPILIWTIKNIDELNKYYINENTVICNNMPIKKD